MNQIEIKAFLQELCPDHFCHVIQITLFENCLQIPTPYIENVSQQQRYFYYFETNERKIAVSPIGSLDGSS